MTKSATAEIQTVLVRVHPLDPTHGHECQHYLLSGSRYPKFVEGKGWYTVDVETAKYLSRVRNNPQDPRSPLVFQICSPSEANALDEVEDEAVARAVDPVPLPSSLAPVNTTPAFPRASVPSRAKKKEEDLVDAALPEPSRDLTSSELREGSTFPKAPIRVAKKPKR